MRIALGAVSLRHCDRSRTRRRYLQALTMGLWPVETRDPAVPAVPAVTGSTRGTSGTRVPGLFSERVSLQNCRCPIRLCRFGRPSSVPGADDAIVRLAPAG
jgi:hypothetical protein